MTYERPQENLRKRATRAIIENAFFDWKSGVVIALTILLSYLGQWDPIKQNWPLLFPWWYFLVGGIVMWAALFASIMTDPAANAKAVADLLRHDFDPKALRSGPAREPIEKALEYRQHIAEQIARTRDGVLRHHLRGTADQIDDWIANLYQLAERLDTYESNSVIRQDLQDAPKALQALQVKLKNEDDASVKEQIRQNIQARQQQLDSLNNLHNMMEKAALQMESTTTALGTVYSQLLLIGVKDIDSGRAQRLREDIGGQVSALHDLVSSVDEVYARR